MPGDLLRTLNAAIDSSEVYTGYKKARIEELRLRKTGARSTEDIYQINCEIIDNYESFLCDSAEYYVLQISGSPAASATPDHLSESRLRLAFLYSLSGLFLQANDISGLSTTDGCLPTRNAAITGTRSAITRT